MGSIEPVAERAALSGVLVVDLSQRAAGRSAAFTLAQLGATVIFVESPAGAPSLFPPEVRLAADADGLAWRANQKSIAADLSRHEGRELLLPLVKAADILLEDDEARMRAIGLDVESAHEANPALIYGSLRPWASDVVFGGRSSETLLQAITGMMSATGYPDGPPMRTGPDYVAILSGIHLATGVTAALLDDAHVGIQVRVVEQEVAMNTASAMFNEATPDLPRLRHGHGTGSETAFCSLFPTKPFGPGDWCAVIVPAHADRSWRALWSAIDREDLQSDPRFISTEARMRNVNHVQDLVAPWMATRTKREAMDVLGRSGIAAAALRSVDEIVASDPAKGDRLISALPSWPARMSRSSVQMEPSSPWTDDESRASVRTHANGVLR